MVFFAVSINIRGGKAAIGGLMKADNNHIHPNISNDASEYSPYAIEANKQKEMW